MKLRIFTAIGYVVFGAAAMTTMIVNAATPDQHASAVAACAIEYNPETQKAEFSECVKKVEAALSGVSV